MTDFFFAPGVSSVFRDCVQQSHADDWVEVIYLVAEFADCYISYCCVESLSDHLIDNVYSLNIGFSNDF